MRDSNGQMSMWEHVGPFVTPAAEPERTIADLQEFDPSTEHLIAFLAHPLMEGINVDGVWLQMHKNNLCRSANDDAKYNTDWKITADDDVVGYLDTEEKKGWHVGGWPYPYINVARRPMAHWVRNSFREDVETKKLRSFREKPEMSWWVGVRKDYRAAMMLHADQLFGFGEPHDLKTKYSDVLLPVYRIHPMYGMVVTSAQEFCAEVISEWRLRRAVRR